MKALQRGMCLLVFMTGQQRNRLLPLHLPRFTLAALISQPQPPVIFCCPVLSIYMLGSLIINSTCRFLILPTIIMNLIAQRTTWCPSYATESIFIAWCEIVPCSGIFLHQVHCWEVPVPSLATGSLKDFVSGQWLSSRYRTLNVKSRCIPAIFVLD